MMIVKTNFLFVLLSLSSSLTTKAFGQSCSICPDGSTFKDSTAIITGISSCGELESSLSLIPAGLECQTQVQTLSQQIAFTAFCCTGVEPPSTCLLCGEGGTVVPDRILTIADQEDTTCEEVSNEALFIVDPEVCSLYSNIALLCCDNGGSGCSICPDGSTIEDSTASIGGFSCGELESSLSPIPAGLECQTQVQSVNNGFAFTAFCCTGIEPPSTCMLCGEGGTVIPDRIIPIPDQEDTTCEGVSNEALFIVDPEVCSLYSAYAPLCCDNGGSGCTLCPDGGPIGNPGNLIFDSEEEPFTCELGAQSLSFSAPDGEQCLDITGPDAEFSFQSWCGCEGVDPPDLCSLCADGEQVTDPEMEVPGYGGLTCGVAVEYARAFNNVTVCEEDLADIRAVCGCEVKPTQAPTQATNSAPTTGQSCSICPDGSTIEDSTASIGAMGFSCGDLKSILSPIPAGSEECQTQVQSLSQDIAYSAYAPLCCDNGGSGCTLCPDGGPIGNPGNLIFDDGEEEPFTCEFGAQSISFFAPDSEECLDITGPDADFSFQSWCGCEGVDPPDLCSLCADGEQVTDPEMEVPGYGGLTCGVAVEFARAFNNVTVCEEDLADIRAVCGCEVKPTQAPTQATNSAPTQATNSAPTQAPSAAPMASFFVSKTASAIFMIGTLVMLLA